MWVGASTALGFDATAVAASTLTGQRQPQDFDLGANAVFTIAVDGGDPIPVTLFEGDTQGNTTIGDLAASLQRAIDGDMLLLPRHGFTNGDIVTYDAHQELGNSPIGGLTDVNDDPAAEYVVVVLDANHIRLATDPADVFGTLVDLTDLGVGRGHELIRATPAVDRDV